MVACQERRVIRLEIFSEEQMVEQLNHYADNYFGCYTA
jgi:hypothetical protein